MPGLSPYKRVLTAGERSNINVRGTTVFLRSATGPIRVKLRSAQVGTATGAAYTLTMTAAEKWFHAEEFDSVEIEEISGAANAIEFYIGYGDFQKPVPDIVNVALSVPAARTLVTVTDKINIDVANAGKQLLAAENLDRTKIIVTALASNVEAIRVGDDNVAVDRGVPLLAGETIAFENTAAIYACSIATVDQGAAVTESET